MQKSASWLVKSSAVLPDTRDAYDAAQVGFNIYLQRSGPQLRITGAAIKSLLNEDERLPPQTTRNHRQVELQQFSTPHAEALVVVTAAALWPGLTALLKHYTRNAA